MKGYKWLAMILVKMCIRDRGTEITHGKIGKAGEHRSPEPNVGIVLINKFDGALDERRSVGGAALIRCESFLRSGYAPGEKFCIRIYSGKRRVLKPPAVHHCLLYTSTMSWEINNTALF